MEVVACPVLIVTVNEDPLVGMRLGFDRSARTLEVGCELTSQGWIVFHADKMTKAYLDLLREGI